jgi:hypothetical protein
MALLTKPLRGEEMKITELKLAWLSAIASAIAALAGFAVAIVAIISATDVHKQTVLSEKSAALESHVSIDRSCETYYKSDVATGDSLIEITGTSGDIEFTDDQPRKYIVGAMSAVPDYFLRCKFTNYSRVPVENARFAFTVSFHQDRVHKRGINGDPFSLEPGEAKSVWIVNTDNDPVAFHSPQLIAYFEPPDPAALTVSLRPVYDDYFVLTRSDDPGEHYAQDETRQTRPRL